MDLARYAWTDLRGRSAIVTGAGGGIGSVFAEVLAAAGASVAAVDIDREKLQALSARLREQGLEAEIRCADVTDPAAMEGVARELYEHRGSLDILVCCAALFLHIPLRPFWEIDPDEWDRVMAVNVKGPFACTRAVAPYMIRQRRGKIVHLSSGTWFKGTPGRLHYVASNAAVVGMVRVLARELGPYGIQVNALAPGRTEHPAFVAAQGRDYFRGTEADRAIPRAEVPEDLVGTLLYLCSPASDFVTGQTLVVDGGSVLH